MAQWPKQTLRKEPKRCCEPQKLHPRFRAGGDKSGGSPLEITKELSFATRGNQCLSIWWLWLDWNHLGPLNLTLTAGKNHREESLITLQLQWRCLPNANHVLMKIHCNSGFLSWYCFLKESGQIFGAYGFTHLQFRAIGNPQSQELHNVLSPDQPRAKQSSWDSHGANFSLGRILRFLLVRFMRINDSWGLIELMMGGEHPWNVKMGESEVESWWEVC